MKLAIFGISSSGLSIFVNLLVLFLILVYIALVYWTYLDAKRRLEDPVLIACATATALIPFLGPIVYTILRPPEFLSDVRERDLEIRASELRVRQLIEQSCPHCEYPIENDYIRCPNCERSLKSPCRNCDKPLDPKWGVCPYCETEVQKQRPKQQQATDSRADQGDRAARRAERQRRAEGQRSGSAQRPNSTPRSGDAAQPTRPGQPARPAPQRSPDRD